MNVNNVIHSLQVSCFYTSKKYRVGQVVVDLGCVDFDLNVPICYPAAQRIQPNSHLPKHNRTGSRMTEI